MREIKFRVWNSATKNMHHPDWGELAVRAKMAEMKLMQYTGLKDKNGVEIYEGDIIEASVWGRAGYNYDDKFEVDFIDGCFRAVQSRKPLNFTCLRKTDEREVIGNIHENSDLLEG